MRYYSILLMAVLQLLLFRDSVLANGNDSITDATPLNGRVVTTATNATPRQNAALPQHKAKQQQPPAVRVAVNLSTQRMHVYEHGKLKYSWKISSGWGRYRTPNGHYKPTWMSRMHYSKQYYNSPMPYSIFFHRGYAIHGTYAVRQLGRPASHGCIRLHPSNARRLFRLVRKYGKAKTHIAIDGTTPKYRPYKRRYKRRYKKKGSDFWPFNL